MDYAPLRPVPLTPAGPVDLDRAVEHVVARVPGLGAAHARAQALALVAIAGTGRAAAAAELGVSADELASLLGSARTALRRTVRPLEGAGWCLRAERLVSDRLDGALGEGGAERLEVHLRNCSRCAEHERRLIQAQNSLVAAFGREPSSSGPAELTLVEPEEQPGALELGGLVSVAAGALLLLAALLVIAAIVFALVAVLGI